VHHTSNGEVSAVWRRGIDWSRTALEMRHGSAGRPRPPVIGSDIKRQGVVLAGVALGAASTVNGYRPLADGGYPSVAAWASGLLASELPLQTIAVQAGALAARSRRLSPRLRRIAWLVSGLSWLGLLGLHRTARAADIPLSAALDDCLGADRRTDAIGLWRQPAPDGAPEKTPGLLRMMRVWRDYAHDADISYGEHGGANLLDIWRHPDVDRDGKAPVLLQVPGGAWTTGNKRGQAHPLMSHLAELGWVCVSMNYRLSPRYTWPDHIVDVKRAIAWIKANIARYGGDPGFIAITGGSAGGHLSSLAALTANDPRFQPGFTESDTRVQAAIPLYGVYDFTRTDRALHPMMVPFLERNVIKRSRVEHLDSYRAASSITYAGPDAPPFFVLHGRNDSFIPVEQARSFVTRLREVSRQPAAYAELPCAQHAFDIFGSARAGQVAVAVGQFLAEIYSARRGCA
jgi:acetyl esterase/lipase